MKRRALHIANLEKLKLTEFQLIGAIREIDTLLEGECNGENKQQGLARGANGSFPAVERQVDGPSEESIGEQ